MSFGPLDPLYLMTDAKILPLFYENIPHGQKANKHQAVVAVRRTASLLPGASVGHWIKVTVEDVLSSPSKQYNAPLEG